MFDNRSNEEEMMQFARHQTAEDYVSVRKSGIEYRRWKMKRPKVSDNEFLDTDAACRALAEYVGCSEQVVGENAPVVQEVSGLTAGRARRRGVRRR